VDVQSDMALKLYTLALSAVLKYKLHLDELPNSIKLDVLESCCLSIDLAAEKGHLDCVKFAFERGAVPTVVTFELATRNGRLECMKYLHQHGCKWDSKIGFCAVYGKNFDCVKFVFETMRVPRCNPVDLDLCACAADDGNFDCLKYLVEQGFPVTCIVLFQAALRGRLECMKFAYQNALGNVWHKDICEVAAGGGHLECLKFAHENGCPWDENTCFSAALWGHLDCLVYAHENGCPWNDGTVAVAAENGHLEIVRYLRKWM
jgi:hypothetical protein